MPNFNFPSFFTASSITLAFVAFAIAVIFAITSSFSTIKLVFFEPLLALTSYQQMV